MPSSAVLSSYLFPARHMRLTSLSYDQTVAFLMKHVHATPVHKHAKPRQHHTHDKRYRNHPYTVPGLYICSQAIPICGIQSSFSCHQNSRTPQNHYTHLSCIRQPINLYNSAFSSRFTFVHKSKSRILTLCKAAVTPHRRTRTKGTIYHPHIVKPY